MPGMDIDSEIAVFHYQRYKSILELCRDRVVLDIACGEGYGSRILADTAARVYGVDIDAETIAEAVKKYADENLAYMEGSAEKLEFPDDMFDVVVSFETIEHVDADMQKMFIREIRRVLKKDGCLVMSSPDKRNYSEIPAFTNRFHVHELYAEEFEAFLQKEFRHVDFYYQGRFCNSYIFDPGKSVSGIHHEICLRKPDPTEAEYIVAVCSDREIRENPESIVCDADNTYYKMNRELICLRRAVHSHGIIIEQKEDYIRELQKETEGHDRCVMRLNGIIEQKENYIQEQRKEMEERDRCVMRLNGTIEQKEGYIQELRMEMEKRDRQLQETEKEMAAQKEKLRKYQSFTETRGIRRLYGLFLKRRAGELQ